MSYKERLTQVMVDKPGCINKVQFLLQALENDPDGFTVRRIQDFLEEEED